MADLKKQFSEVKAHIDAGRYAAARNYLKRIDHPTAREWEARLDKLDPPGARKAAALKSSAGSGMARTFRWIWGILTLMACGWIVYGLLVASNAYGKTVAGTASEAGKAGAAVGASLGVGIFLCTGGPLLLIFGFLYWRNGVAIRNARQHEEVIEAMKGN